MKKVILSAIVLMTGCIKTSAQVENSNDGKYTKFPIVVSLQCHALTLPFRDIKANFSNFGIGLGTELSLNAKHNLVQQVTGVWFRNKAVGNGLLLYSQTAFRPTFGTHAYAEVKAGAGYMYSFRPVESYRQKDGEWQSVGHRGKGLLTVPIGVSVGYDIRSSGTYLSPFVSYQFLVVTGYNMSVPIVPETLVQIGSRIYFKSTK